MRCDRRRPCVLSIRQKAPPAFVGYEPAGETRVEHRAGQQLQMGIARERCRSLARSDAVAVLVDREDGHLQTVDQTSQPRLSFGVLGVVVRQFLKVEESTFERPLYASGRRDECIHFADQHVDFRKMREEGHASSCTSAAGLRRLERRRKHHDRNVRRTRPFRQPLENIERIGLIGSPPLGDPGRALEVRILAFKRWLASIGVDNVLVDGVIVSEAIYLTDPDGLGI